MSYTILTQSAAHRGLSKVARAYSQAKQTQGEYKFDLRDGTYLVPSIFYKQGQASATVTCCGVDVTDEYIENAFHWTRDSGDMEADAVWNAAHAGMKSVTFAATDIDGDVKISCTLTGNSATYGSITVDDDMDASHTPAELDANDVFVIENGYLKVTTSRGNAYVLENGRLKAAGAKLNGSITAETRLFASQPENIVEFSYDFNRQRTQKKVTKNDGDVEIFNYTLYGKLLMHLSCGLNEMHFFYDGNKRPAAVEFNGTFYSYIQNSQGDIVGIIDNNGDIVVEYRYDAWGKMVMMKSKDIEYNLLAEMNPFRYRGYIWDGEMDLFYLRNRYYEDSVGRFINADSLLGLDYGLIGHNTFAYCLNKPVEMCDCDGRSVGGATAYSFSQGATYQNYLKNKDREEYDARVRESYLNRIEENKRLEKRASDARKLGISLRGVPENLMPLNKHTIEKSYVYLEASITIDYFVDENGINYMRVSNLSWSVPDDYEDNVKQIDLVYTSGTAFSREYRFMMDCTYNGKILNVGGGATPTPQNISACSLSVILMFNDGSKNSVTIGEDNIIGIFSEIMPTTK